MGKKGWKPSKTNKSIIGKLVKELRKDQSEGSYYHSWKASIAMAFIDEVNSVPDVFKNDLHNNANNAADRFLQQLIAE